MTASERAPVTYPRLEAPGFGRLRVEAEEWDRDLYVRADGKVKARDKKLAKAVYGTSHTIGPAELEKVCKKGARTLVIGSGYAGVARLSPEGWAYLQERGIAVRVLPTPEAVEEYLRTPGPKAILVHVTC